MKFKKIRGFLASLNECCWCLLGAVTTILGFVMLILYGWPTGDWKIGWGAFGAISSFATGAIAARIAFVQHRKNNDLIKNKKKLFDYKIAEFSKILERRKYFVYGEFYNLLYWEFVDGYKEHPGLSCGKLKKSAEVIKNSLIEEGYFPDFKIENDDLLFLNESQLDGLVSYSNAKRELSLMAKQEFARLNFVVCRADYFDYVSFLLVLINGVCGRLSTLLAEDEVNNSEILDDVEGLRVKCINDLSNFESLQTNYLVKRLYSN